MTGYACRRCHPHTKQQASKQAASQPASQPSRQPANKPANQPINQPASVECKGSPQSLVGRGTELNRCILRNTSPGRLLPTQSTWQQQRCHCASHTKPTIQARVLSPRLPHCTGVQGGVCTQSNGPSPKPHQQSAIRKQVVLRTARVRVHMKCPRAAYRQHVTGQQSK